MVNLFQESLMYMLQKSNRNTAIAVNGKIIWQDRGASKLSTDTLDAVMRNVMAGFVLQDQEIMDGWRDEHTTHTPVSLEGWWERHGDDGGWRWGEHAGETQEVSMGNNTECLGWSREWVLNV